eukprot:UN17645
MRSTVTPLPNMGPKAGLADNGRDSNLQTPPPRSRGSGTVPSKRPPPRRTSTDSSISTSTQSSNLGDPTNINNPNGVNPPRGSRTNSGNRRPTRGRRGRDTRPPPRNSPTQIPKDDIQENVPETLNEPVPANGRPGRNSRPT